MKFMIIIAFVLLASCTDPVEQEANKAFAEKKYLKAFSLYKKAIQKKPGKDTLYRNLEKTSAYIVAEGVNQIQHKNYQDSIDLLSTLVEDEQFPVGDARLVSSIAHFHNRKILNHQSSLENIQKGLYLLSTAINDSKSDLPTVDLTQNLARWFVDRGLLPEDLLGNDFNQYDMSHIYRVLFFYDLVENIVATEKSFYPISDTWEKEDATKLKTVYKLFSWMIHNFNVCDEEDPYYYPASIANTIVRGYGTTKEQIKSFIFLCLQKQIPTYLLELKEQHKYYAVCNVGKYWVTFDFENKQPIFENKIIEDTGKILSSPSKIVWLVFPSHSVVPRLSKLSQVYQLIQVPSPSYHYNVYHMTNLILKKLGKGEEVKIEIVLSENSDVRLSDEEIQIWKLYTLEKDKTIEWTKKQQLNPEETNMRISMLVGDLETSVFYSVNATDPQNAEFFEYYVAVLYKNKNDFVAAKEKFSYYLEKYPQGFWKKLSLLQLAQIAICEKNISLAKDYYAQVLAPEIVSFYTEE